MASTSYHVQCSSWVGKRAGCKRNWAQSSVRTTKIQAQFSAQTTQNRAQFRVRSMKTWAQICKHKHFYISCLKTQWQLHFVNGGKKKINNFCLNNSGRALVNRAGRKPLRAGRSALRNMPSWNTDVLYADCTFTRQSASCSHALISVPWCCFHL